MGRNGFILIVTILSLSITLSALAATKESDKTAKPLPFCSIIHQKEVQDKIVGQDTGKNIRSPLQLKTVLDTFYYKAQEMIKARVSKKTNKGGTVVFKLIIEPRGDISSVCVGYNDVNDNELVKKLAETIKTLKFSYGDYRAQYVRYPLPFK